MSLFFVGTFLRQCTNVLFMTMLIVELDEFRTALQRIIYMTVSEVIQFKMHYDVVQKFTLTFSTSNTFTNK